MIGGGHASSPDTGRPRRRGLALVCGDDCMSYWRRLARGGIIESAMTSQPSSSGTDPALPVLVRHGGRAWRLLGGQALTFGRGLDVDIRLASHPPDLRVSRHTGTLRHLIDTVLVVNASSHGLLTLAAEGAVTREIGPREAITCDPHQIFRVCVIGEYGATYDVDVDASAIPDAGSDHRQHRGPGTVLFTLYDLTPGQRKVLTALVAPLVAGESRSATTREIAAAVDLQPNYVRNVLKDIRERLTAQGVPGLLGENNAQAVEALRDALAQWAIRNRVGLDL